MTNCGLLNSCQSVQNLGLAIVAMVSGIIVDKGGYFMLEIFFIGLLCSELIYRVALQIFLEIFLTIFSNFQLPYFLQLLYGSMI